MADQRVDKSWQTKGLDAYSTEAVLGTLNHYGAKVDEAAFRALAAEHYPMQIARRWLDAWAGKGQFSHFPASAAGLLWSRLMPEVLAPQAFALAWTQVLHRLATAPEDPELVGLFEAAEKVATQLPVPGPRRDAFLSEGLALVGAVNIDVGALVERLAEQKSAQLPRLLALADAFFPELQGLLGARAKAGQGDRAGAIVELAKWSADASRTFDGRAAAVEELVSMRAATEALEAARALHLEAVKNKSIDQVGRLHDVMHGLLHVLPQQGDLRTSAMKIVSQQHALLEQLGAQVHH